ncbi:acetylcholine receptor subunit delta-like [Haliotis rubra]|uniref:acetylcholine receptor subunit delta-like n=1 Tax=Haliotis rubra TaxID=36100 RepID=UPI001EE5E118|nr:acetylcholine receptor subunit delta-like [Haliotis rubra]
MLDRCRVLAVCVFLSAVCSLQSAIDQGPLYAVYNDLLENYKTYIRPRKNASETVDVLVSYSLASVEALEENTQTLISTGYVWLEWTDDLLTWNSDRYGNITNITIPVEKLWFPDLLLLNGLDDPPLIYPDGETARTEMVFTFVFKRKYLYYVITNILPVMLLSVLNLGVFLLPPETGEKVSLCISIVLSYAVYMSAISGRLPEVSDTVTAVLGAKIVA